MKRLPGFLVLLASLNAFAARPTIGHQPFPDDFVPHPCAAAAACASLSRSQIVDAAATLRGYTIDQAWLEAHWDEMLELVRPTCAKLATCYATPGNGSLFCMDLLFPEFWGKCDRYPKDSADYEQCSLFMRIYSLRADLKDKETWEEAQACAAKQPARTQPGTMKVWMSPERIGEEYSGKFTVYALDVETRVPIQALVTMEGTRLSARAPGGKPWTNYEIEWPVKFRRVPNADGHTDLVPPSVTVTADGYAPITLTLPAEPRKVVVGMTPSAEKLKPGPNTVTVTAKDVVTGQPVELRVMLGDTVAGDTNKPITIELPKGQKRPEIWATSLFEKYSDIVVAPAGK